ncbi:MAG: class I SAM-dependent methyltransferase [Abitibacteriaceae bacterium]|nr:class I SAM-dependent methyltransferase [Abditibacteriaceae bacterium]MBV9868279.1 class I SAM-dependent methyltransferase [Abditibacteriaceae bacterium]
MNITTESQFGDLAPYYDELMHMVPYEQWVEYVMVLFGFVEHTPHNVLDCACGTGNVTLELAKNHLKVTGVDLSQPMIEVAQQKAAKLATPLPVRFLQADLTAFDLGETFDSATCLYDSLNYILEPNALQSAFGCIASHVEPNGVFVFDMNSEYALQADLFSQRNYDPRQALHYDWRASYDPPTRVCSVEMKFERNQPDGSQQVFYEMHRERAYSLAEIETMLHATGWQLLNVFDAYTLNRPHGRSERWFFVARRVK